MIFIKFLNGEEDILLNILILSRKQYLKKNFKENNLKNNIYLVVNDEIRV